MTTPAALLAAALFATGCATTRHQPDALAQVSTINSLMAGQFQGQVPFAEVARHGDIGLGTVDGLDGEMIGVDGVFYRIDFNGDARPVAPTDTTPFAAVAPFSPDSTTTVEAASLAALRTAAEARIDPRFFHVLRVDGTFANLHVRSVARQPNGRALTEVLAEQSEFRYDTVEGTLVGIYSPAWAAGLNVPGYHFHFINAGRTRGGHVLDAGAISATLAVDRKLEWTVLVGENFVPGDAGAGLPAARMKSLFAPAEAE
jgi:acetolactate decarboxylase